MMNPARILSYPLVSFVAVWFFLLVFKPFLVVEPFPRQQNTTVRRSNPDCL